MGFFDTLLASIHDAIHKMARFHKVLGASSLLASRTGSKKLTTNTLSRTLERLSNIKPELSAFVGCDLANEIETANAIKTGARRTSTPKSPD